MGLINNVINKDVFNNSEKLTMSNVGFYPISKTIKENELFKHESTLYLEMLNNIETLDKTLLDIGCNKGGGLSIYQQYFNFKKLVGIDINKKFIEFAKIHYKNINFQNMNLNNILFKNQEFDIIVAVESLYHCTDQSILFKKIKDILKPQGTLIIADQPEVINFEELSKNFSSIYQIDITENVIQSCKEIINNIDSYNLLQNEKEYMVYCSKDNYEYYHNSKNKFFKIICSNLEG